MVASFFGFESSINAGLPPLQANEAGGSAMVFCFTSKGLRRFVNVVDKVLEKQDNTKNGAARHLLADGEERAADEHGKREIVVVGADPSH
ncbi:MAG: hypothetical protein ACK4N4_04340 [Burkholderiales bacterium]